MNSLSVKDSHCLLPTNVLYCKLVQLHFIFCVVALQIAMQVCEQEDFAQFKSNMHEFKERFLCLAFSETNTN